MLFPTVEYNNFDDLIIPKGYAEASGCAEKHWLYDLKNEKIVGLFKYPKEGTLEHISEHMAATIGNAIGIRCAKIELGTYNGREGCLSFLIYDKKEYPELELIEGVNLLKIQYPQYDENKLVDLASGEMYSLDMIYNSLINNDLRGAFTLVPIFDFIIGNSDRHQSNWAIIRNSLTYDMKFAPLYDNGSSLCSRIKDVDIPLFFKDQNRMNALVNSKSRSCIKINNIRNTRHVDVIRYAIQKNYIGVELIGYISDVLENQLDSILDSYSGVISPKRKDLIAAFLRNKLKLLNQICEEAL